MAASALGTIVASALGKAPSLSERRSALDQRVHLGVGQLEATGERVGVGEQQVAGGGGDGARTPADEQRGPSSRSSAPTCCDTAGWLRASASAARENEPWRATSRNVSRRRGSSIGTAYRYRDIDYLNLWPIGLTLKPCT